MSECNPRLANTLRYCAKRAFALDGYKGYIYVIQCHGFIKIGVATDPRSRLSNLQCGCPYKLVLVRYFASRDPCKDEKDLHDLLGKHHHRGEWFRLTKPMRELLKHWGK